MTRLLRCSYLMTIPIVFCYGLPVLPRFHPNFRFRYITTIRNNNRAIDAWRPRRAGNAITGDDGFSKKPSPSPARGEPSNSVVVTGRSVGYFVFLDLLFRRIMKQTGSSFPHALVGCSALFVTMLLGGEQTARPFQPGASLIAQWLPVLFCPILITLPLADGVGSTAELLKLGAIVVGGFFFTLLTTAESVILVRRFTSNGEGKATNEVLVLEKEKKDAGVIPKQTTQNPFSERLIRRLQSWMVTSGLAALILSRYKSNGMISGLMTSIFMLITTLHNYAFGSRFPSEVRRIVHPLVTCTTMTWLVAWFFGMAKRVSFSTILKSYQIGNVAMNSGAGDLLLYMLGPMIISLSVSMYGRRKLLKDNLKEVAAAVSVTSMGTLFTTGAVVRLMGVNPRFRLSMVSRVVTPSLAISIANILNANVSIAVSAVVLTGLIGASFGTGVLDLVGIHDPIVRGLSMGACAHGLGTGAMSFKRRS